MKQEDVAGKILAELKSLEIVNDSNDWIVYNFLKQAYAAGFDRGRQQNSKRKPIARLDDEGNILQVYESQKAAAHDMKLDVSTIRRALTGVFLHAGGFRWGYVNDSNVSSSQQEETIGSYLKQLAREAQRTHSSKKD